MTAGELGERSAEAARRLAGYRVTRGDRVLWVADPSEASLACALGVLRLGAVLVPLSPALTGRELGQVVGDGDPAAVIVPGPVAATVAGPEQLLVISTASRSSGARRDRGNGTVSQVPVLAATLHHLAGPAPDPHLREADLDRESPLDPALIVYTSGTTGSPKGAVLTHGNLAAGAAALRRAWRIDPDDRLSLSLPLFHVHGLCAGLFTMLDAGASLLVYPRFDPARLSEDFGRRRVTVFFGVPTMYYRMVKHGAASELRRLRLAVSGSAPLSPSLWARVAETAGVGVLERYGMTETLLTLSNPYEGERRPGTVGLPLPGVEAMLAGEAGELLVAGPSVFDGYWRRPAATAESFRGRWFKTGDVACKDEAGYFVIKARTREVIISGGHNVYPAEVEDVLLQHDGVDEVAVVGTPSEEWGEVVTAWVVPSGSGTAVDDVMSFAAARLAPYKVPRAVRLVESLPRNAMGKVVRGELRDGSRATR